MTETIIAIPETCTEHPDAGTAHLESTSAYLQSGGKVEFREYSCSVASCRRPLTWEFNCPDQGVRITGSGHCQDQQVNDAMDCARYDQRSDSILRIGGTVVVLLLVAVAYVTLQSIDGWRLPIFAGYILASISIAVAFFIVRDRKRPPWPQFTRDETA